MEAKWQELLAGNGRSSRGVEKGVATQSSIIVVKLGDRGRESFARTTEIMRAIKFVVEKAIELEMPLVVNLSLGTNDGAHSGSSLFTTYLDDMEEMLRANFVVSSGNEGFAAHHYSAIIGKGETLDINFKTIPNLASLYLAFWKDFTDTFEVELVAPNGQSSGKISPYTRFKIIDIGGTIVNVYNNIPVQYNQEQEIFFRFIPPIADGIWKLIVTGLEITDGRFNIWLPTMEEVTAQTGFLIPSVETTLTIPATSRNAITVGGYNSRTNGIADFSGRGYTRNNVYVKPDLVAPAINVLTTKAGGGYDRFSGTSAAAPFVTGTCALMMEWGIIDENDPFLYGQRVKAFLRKGATRMQNVVYPNPRWGYGRLCIRDTLNYLVQYKT